jgi:hypothetical protein
MPQRRRMAIGACRLGQIGVDVFQCGLKDIQGVLKVDQSLTAQ